MPNEPAQDERRKDLVHIVNVLICSARDGQYGTKKHMDLYEKFRRMVGKTYHQEYGWVRGEGEGI